MHLQLQDAFVSLGSEDEQGGSPSPTDGNDATAGADKMAGGRRKRSPRQDTVLVAVDIAAANTKAAASIQAWLRSEEHQSRLVTYLSSKDTGLRVLELQVRACVCGPNDEAIGFEMYTPFKCPPNIQNHHHNHRWSPRPSRRSCTAPQASSNRILTSTAATRPVSPAPSAATSPCAPRARVCPVPSVSTPSPTFMLLDVQMTGVN